MFADVVASLAGCKGNGQGLPTRTQMTLENDSAPFQCNSTSLIMG